MAEEIKTNIDEAVSESETEQTAECVSEGTPKTSAEEVVAENSAEITQEEAEESEKVNSETEVSDAYDDSVGESEEETSVGQPVDENETVDKEEIAEIIERSVEEKIGSISTNIKSMEKYLQSIESRISQLRKLADMHEDIENNLNRQINQYKDNFYRRIVIPILSELFDLQEEMCMDRGMSEIQGDNILDEYIESITKIIGHYGATVRFVSEGDKYDPAVHKPLKAVPTDKKENDKTVAKVKKRTVHFIDGVIVERAGVFVYQYKEPEVKEEEKIGSVAQDD